MALAIALSVIATTGTGIVLSARIVYGMANYRVLPEFLGTVSPRWSTPIASSLVVGFLIVVLSAVYFLVTSVQNAFSDVIDVTGLLFSVFYILTALAAMSYYRRRIISGAWDFVSVGLLPLAAAGFLGWVLVKSIIEAPSTQRWSVIGIVVAGVILMLVARFILHSPFFQMERESENRNTHRRSSWR
jgi:amino acid transporter